MARHQIYDSMHPDSADILTGPCLFCGQQGWITIPQTAADALIQGLPVQDALPELGFRLREQIISGTHPRCAPGAEFGDGIHPDLFR
jgi:hypothetical protein